MAIFGEVIEYKDSLVEEVQIKIAEDKKLFEFTTGSVSSKLTIENVSMKNFKDVSIATDGASQLLSSNQATVLLNTLSLENMDLSALI